MQTVAQLKECNNEMRIERVRYQNTLMELARKQKFAEFLNEAGYTAVGVDFKIMKPLYVSEDGLLTYLDCNAYINYNLAQNSLVI